MESSGPAIAAVVCTHNRADEVRGAIESLLHQTLPVSAFEIVVVDNASTDGTDRVVAELAATAKNVRYLREERLGLSIARNTGGAATTARYVAYMDDDARAYPNWLESILRAFTGTSPAPAALGGRVFLDWGGPAPPWLPPRFQSLYTWVDLGDRGRLFGPGDYVVGANMAFRRDVLDRLGGFRKDLGRRGDSLMGGEDTVLIHELQAAGLPVYYEPAAVVMHRVPPDRRRRSWLYRRMFWDGASQPLLSGSRRMRRGYARLVLYDLRVLVRLLLRAAWRLARGDRRQSTDYSLQASQRLGRLRSHMILTFRRWDSVRGRLLGDGGGPS